MTQKKAIGLFSLPVIVAALGYFVDIYDLLLFGIIRKDSLGEKGLQLSIEVSDRIGMIILNWQMAGLLIGGILWGMMGDKKGRLSVLFGSIILYSTANILNGFVHNVDQYIVCRFIAGIGLAGELGAGITLVSELIPKEKRSIATSIVAGVGLTGAIAAYFIAQSFGWRNCFFIGGGLGIMLLFLRVSVFESGMYATVKESDVKKGNFLMFFTNKYRFKKYLFSILIGTPCWYVIGMLITFSNKFSENLGFPKDEKVIPGKAVMLAYVAISIADLLIGLVSHVLKSRKKAMYIFYTLTIIGIVLYFSGLNNSVFSMYAIIMLLGFGTGFWALFVTMAAEHFGTNLRATAATTAPNMVRGSLIIMTFIFYGLQEQFKISYVLSGEITGVIVMIISSIALILTEETYAKDLNFLEK